MKHLFMTYAVLLGGCVDLGIAATATDHHEYNLPSTPSVNVIVPVTVSATLDARIAQALRSAGNPSSPHIDSVDLSAVITSARLGMDTTLAGIYGCRIDLTSDSASLSITDYQLTPADRGKASVELPLQHATLDELRPLTMGSNARLTTTLQINPAELTAHRATTDLVVDVGADVEASL
jgi:hypothetical protein